MINLRTPSLTRVPAVAAVALAIVTAASSAASAANYSAMGCSQLWYARNAIYAAKGYCFQTAQAQAVFGRGCFPPYGRLSTYEQQQVNEITYWERTKGCG